MNAGMQAQYTEHVLRRNWKSAAQVLKAALAIDPKDAGAAEQLADQRGRFLSQAQERIRRAQDQVAAGTPCDWDQMLSEFDTRHPEWVEFRDTEETLVLLWNNTHGRPAVEVEPEPAPEEVAEVIPQDPVKEESPLNELMEKCRESRLQGAPLESLLDLQRQLEEAEVGFTLGVHTGDVSRANVVSALSDVRARITRAQAKKVGLVLGLVFSAVGLLIGGLTRYYLQLPKSRQGAGPQSHQTSGGQSLKSCNPKPAADDFILPLPLDGQMVFRPIAIPLNGQPPQNQSLEFDPVAGNGKRLKVYAPFEAAHGKVYYLGKYEVTEGQYDAVMSPSALRQSLLPMRNVSYDQAKEFCLQYTVWLQQQHQGKLPRSKGGQIAVIRLPDSAEWEYAARGGNKTFGTATFGQKFPYPEKDLNRFEWFGGTKSSHYEVHPIGQLNASVVGCFDLIGNVREITRTRFQREDSDLSAVVVRGGDFGTPEEEMKVALEAEHPFTAPFGGGPFRNERRGFRVVLGTSEVDWQTQLSATPVPFNTPGGSGER